MTGKKYALGARLAALLLLASLMLALTPQAAAQEEGGLELRLKRRFGYGGVGEIQGAFTLRVEAPVPLRRVTYYLDGQVMGTAAEVPFEFRFSTGEYETGLHEIWAEGVTQDGLTLRSQTIRVNFLSAEEAWRAGARVMGILLAAVGGLSVAAWLITRALARDRGNFVLGRYGLSGGAVCPRCGLPFARPFWALNMLVGKLSRCPHCGKWSIVPRSSQQALQEAEARYRALQAAGEEAPAPGETDWRRLLEESRFEQEPPEKA